ncbi:MAG: aldo/keto reductase [Thermoanaerobaculia bacterium]
MITRTIPGSSEQLPLIGLGTWKTFDVAGTSQLDAREEVLRGFLKSGGQVVDTSPMYGRSEEVIGELRERIGLDTKLFLATKVWTSGRDEGILQMQSSMKKMRTGMVDLMQVHNLVDWDTHLETMKRWKEEGAIRYVGVTHYQVKAFSQLESIMKRRRVDFVQLPYSAAMREAEKTLLPLAREQQIGVIVNRPFEEADLLRATRSKPLPEWASEIGCESWSELLLKFIVSHPAVTCVIPATSNREHLAQNMRAGEEPMPDEAMRERIAAAVQ